MKVGDKYYCIKDRFYKDYILNKAGKIYEITELHELDTSIVKEVFTTTENVYGYLYEMYINVNISRAHQLFYDYFISLKEYRKLKLDKLNESR